MVILIIGNANRREEMLFQNYSGMRGMKNTIPAGKMKLRDRMVYKISNIR